MKRLLIPTLILLFITSLAGIAFTALAKEMSVQVDETKLRATPAYYGAVVATVNYADRLIIIDTKGSWVKASHPRSRSAGWLHISALTGKKLAPKASSKNAPTSVSYGELSAAEKGFTEQIEKDYRQKNRNIDFTWVDKMEKIRVSPEQSTAFLREGQVKPETGGEP